MDVSKFPIMPDDDADGDDDHDFWRRERVRKESYFLTADVKEVFAAMTTQSVDEVVASRQSLLRIHALKESQVEEYVPACLWYRNQRRARESVTKTLCSCFYS
jgi:hypothetical protein